MEINELKDTLFYSSINELLNKNIPKIKNKLEQKLYENDNNKIISKLKCEYGTSTYGDIQWRMDGELKDGVEILVDDTLRPYMIGSFWSMELVYEENIMLHYNSGQLFNDFSDYKDIDNKFIIEIGQLNNIELIENIKQKTIEFFKILENTFFGELKIFNEEYNKLLEKYGVRPNCT